MDGAVMKKIKKNTNFFALSALAAAMQLFIPSAVNAEDIISAPLNVKTSVSGFDFSKTYKTSSENLFYLLLSALNENNYSIEEIQFKTGSVLFKAYTKEFIASIASKGAADSFIKIIPADNNYNFSPLLIHRLHKYIETNNNINFQRIL